MKIQLKEHQGLEQRAVLEGMGEAGSVLKVEDRDGSTFGG